MIQNWMPFNKGIRRIVSVHFKVSRVLTYLQQTPSEGQNLFSSHPVMPLVTTFSVGNFQNHCGLVSSKLQ